jgi:hypothetical protein
MGARSDNKGYIKVDVDVLPETCAEKVRVGVRKMGATTVLASAAVQAGGKTSVEFSNAGNFQRYEVVAGVDANSDGALQNSEVSEVMPDQFVLVTQSDYDGADSLLAGGTLFPLGIAADLLSTFRTDVTPPGAARAVRTLGSPQLTHPVGAVWEVNNTAIAAHYTFDQLSSVAQTVAAAPQTMAVVQSHLGSEAQKGIIQSYFNQNPLDIEHTFGPWPIPATTVIYSTVPQLLVAFGHVQISGRMWVTVRSADLAVSAVEYEGTFTDLYDFDHNATAPAPTAATVQTGYSTLGTSGKVFFTTVEFRRWTNDIVFRFE